MSDNEFDQDGLKEVLGSRRKFKVVWRVLWVVVEGGLAVMEASFGG